MVKDEPSDGEGSNSFNENSLYEEEISINKIKQEIIDGSSSVFSIHDICSEGSFPNFSPTEEEIGADPILPSWTDWRIEKVESLKQRHSFNDFDSFPLANSSWQSEDVDKDSTSTSKKITFRCHKCNLEFKSVGYLDHHYISKHSRWYSCKLCTKKFRDKENLKNHSVVHRINRPFKCPKCIKYFKTKGERNIHAMLHQRDKTFNCCFCKKTYKIYDNLTRHLSTHKKTA